MTNLFEWQRAMRSASLPGSVKLLLWTIGSYAGMDGRDARPSAPRLCSDMGLSRQRIFELLKDAQETGWITRVSRPGRSTEYLLTVPYPSDPSDGLSSANVDDPSDTSYGFEAPYPSDTSDGSIPYPSDQSDATRQTHLTRPTQDQHNGGRAAPRTPRRTTTPQAPSWTDQSQAEIRDGPDDDPSPKPDPPPARASPAPVVLKAVS